MMSPNDENCDMDEECRLAFESWAHRASYCLDMGFFEPDCDCYVSEDTRSAFRIWTAAWKSATQREGKK